MLLYDASQSPLHVFNSAVDIAEMKSIYSNAAYDMRFKYMYTSGLFVIPWITVTGRTKTVKHFKCFRPIS